MAEDTNAKAAVAARDFNDAGTGASFTKGGAVDVDPGTLANYRHAGLLADDDAAGDAPLELTDPVT